MSTISVGITAAGGPGLGDGAALAETLGFDSLWAGEHIANWGAGTMSAIPTAAVMAARTTRIKVGTSVLLFPLRHPTIVAKEFATLDVISQGRVILGIGVGGENPKEFEACGIPVKERGARTNEGLEIVRKLWTQEEVTYNGRYFKMEGIRMAPKPVQQPSLPIYVAGRRDAAMRRAARHGDGWFPYLYDPERYRQSVATITEVAEQAGKKMDDFGWAIYQFIALEKSYEDGLRVAARSLQAMYRQDFQTLAPRYAVLGTAAQCVERLHDYYEAGARHLVLVPLGGGDSRQAVMEHIAGEVLPALRKF